MVSNFDRCFDAKYLKNAGDTSSCCVNHYFKLNVSGALAVCWFIQEVLRLCPSEFLVKTLIQTFLSICDECSSVVQFFHWPQVATG